MSDEHGDGPAGDRRGLGTDPTALARLAELLDVPTPPNATWRAATVTLFATDPAEVTIAHLHHVQDLEWPVPERALLELAVELLHRHARGSTP